MSRQGTIRRYSLIIEKLKSKKYSSFEIVKDYLFEHGFEISSRTLQRDIEQLRFEFGIDIKYERIKNSYYIEADTSHNLDGFLRFLEIVNTAELLTESLKESKDTLSYISFESRGDLRGIKNLKPLLFAIKNCRIISFLHEKFNSGKQKRYLVKPHLLKEYQNRWYVIGTNDNTKEMRTFGIDRISALIVQNKTFKQTSGINLIKLFESTIGLVYSLEKVEDIILSFTPLQAKYIKALPLHKSQEVLKENKKEVQIRLRITPNYEFKQKVLMLGETVIVLKPYWLADEIKKSLANTLKKYK